MDELEGEDGEAVVEWDPVLKIPIMKNTKWRQTVGVTRLALRFARWSLRPKGGREQRADLCFI